MNLYRKTRYRVDGFGAAETETYTYMLSETESIKDDDEITQDDVVEADQYYLDYYKYENLGNITDDEVKILSKFGVL